MLNAANFVARPLEPMRMLLCAAPAYLSVRGVPQTVDALSTHDLLQLQTAGREQPMPYYLQTRSGGGRNMQTLQLPPRFLCNDFRGLAHACIAGVGIAQLPQPLVLAALRAGTLKTLLPDNMPEGLQLFIHYPSRKQLPARVRVFVDFCIEHFGGHPDFLQGFLLPKSNFLCP